MLNENGYLISELLMVGLSLIDGYEMVTSQLMVNQWQVNCQG